MSRCGRRHEVRRLQNNGITATEELFYSAAQRPIPDSICVQLYAQMDGEYKRLPNFMNKRPVFCNDEPGCDGPWYLLFSDHHHWVLRSHLNADQRHQTYIMCGDPAAHPGCVQMPWQTVSEKTGKFEDD